MGAWGIGPFDNDDASDWLYELEKSSDTSTIAAALDAVIDIGDGYLDVSDCSPALAAAEVVAALRGHPIADLPENAAAWVNANLELDASSLVPIALTVIERIGADSELKDLWEESDEVTTWLATLDDLSNRLNG